MKKKIFAIVALTCLIPFDLAMYMAKKCIVREEKITEEIKALKQNLKIYLKVKGV